MKAEDQRIAIAELCGWKRVENFHETPEEKTWAWSKDGDDALFRVFGNLPDYPNDLNAMHEAEKVLQEKCLYWPDYIDELSKLFRHGFSVSVVNWSQMCHATAAQRAEAFLRTLHKWPEPATKGEM